MRIMLRSPSSCVPATHRISSGADHRFVQQNPYPYSPRPSYCFTDPYRMAHRYAYPYRRFHIDHRSLSQRLWDIDSGSEQEEIEERAYYRPNRISPTKQRLSRHLYNDRCGENYYDPRRPAFV